MASGIMYVDSYRKKEKEGICVFLRVIIIIYDVMCEPVANEHCVKKSKSKILTRHLKY